MRPALLRGRHWTDKVRPAIYARDNGQCQLCGGPIDLRYRSPHPYSYEVHHTVGWRETGNDTQYLVATHRICNARAGKPGTEDPAPKMMTRW